ncbi:MAG: cystathionine beta-synthase [Micrococcales bacterium]
MKYANNLVELIGNTPLVKLNKVTDGIACTVLAKVEYFNPGGSIKDRIATKMVDEAEARGLLKPGGTIVEPTSGNTGIGLALVAQQRGYRCIFVLPDKVAEDKRNTLVAYGAEIVVCPTAVAHEDPESYYSVSDRLAREIPGAWKPDQYSNPNGPLSHYEATGPEIWRDTDGKVTHVVIGVGTGGTISGTGRYLKEVSKGAVKVIGCDPEGSVYSNGTGRPYLVEGVGRGDDFLPEAFDPNVVDEILPVTDRDSFEMTRRLAREEGMLVGPSCGMAVVAALRVARDLPADAVVVVILPDGGRGYLAKVFNDKWMRSYGFMQATDGETVDIIVKAKSGDIPDLVHVHPDNTVKTALDICKEFDVSLLPVLVAEPPVRIGEVTGSVREEDLINKVFTGELQLTDPIAAAIGPKPGVVGIGDTIEAARKLLETDEALLVLEDGKPISVITRHDVLDYLSK